MSIRVLQIIPTLDQGGAEKQMALLSAGLPTDRFDVHVATLTRLAGPLLPQLEASNIPLHDIGKSWKVDLGAYQRTKATIRRLRPDVVHTWIFAANAYGRKAAFAAGVKHVVAGERCVDEWKTWRELMIDRWLAKRTSCIATNSGGVRDFYAARGIPADKFVIIPNGIVLQPPDSQTTSSLRSDLHLTGDARLIGAVGRLWAQKRYEDLIRAAERLGERRDDTHLVIIGDGPLRGELERRCQQSPIAKRLHMLGHRTDVPTLMKDFACLWLGSGYEGQSNSLMEAMSAGLPVVATDIPGNRDLVVAGETGFLEPVGDVEAFAQRTNELLQDQALAERLGNAGRDRMRGEFSVEKMVSRYAVLYEDLVSGRRPPFADS